MSASRRPSFRLQRAARAVGLATAVVIPFGLVASGKGRCS